MHFTHRRARARALTVVAATVVAAMTLAACSSNADDPSRDVPLVTSTAQAEAPSPVDGLLADHGLAGMDARHIIDAMDALPLADRPTDLVLSVRPDELVVKGEDGLEASLPMPQDAFYVSIAPYVDSNHDCYFHSLTTCTGEMGNQSVHVVVTDATTGDVVLDEARTTFDNGFVGLWLPRGIDAQVTIEADAGSATMTLPTRAADDATCVTTMRLA